MSSSTTSDPATLYFTHIQLEEQIRNVRNEILRIRNDDSVPLQIRIFEILRLFDVLSELEVESTRQQEDYLVLFLSSLQLSDINCKPMTEGKLRCHITQSLAKRTKQRAVSYGFYDNYADKGGLERDGFVFPSGGASGILIERRKEINKELAEMSQSDGKSAATARRRRELANELHEIEKE